MVNRCLSLLVFAVAFASAAAMLIAGAHPTGAVTLAERAPCTGLTILALALIHLRIAPGRSTPAEAAMWCGLSTLFIVATFASPHLGPCGIAAALSLVGTSVARLVCGRARAGALAQSPLRVASSPEF